MFVKKTIKMNYEINKKYLIIGIIYVILYYFIMDYLWINPYFVLWYGMIGIPIGMSIFEEKY